MAITRLPPEFERQVELYIEVTVGGERLFVQTRCVEAVYNDPAAREQIERMIRSSLMDRILEKWTPVIRVRR